ncbi:hypothetical protein F2Q68_00035738 [Brassica cretica]|uniref:Uncharacterized protein n=1 Tax=Brassica cretica TaxID=69181 RepID=A0A8S9GWK9_BRACR|nr:hypothetical protein F2Q68_00035738 [Brassica cretica]
MTRARVHRSAVLASSLCHDSAVSPCPQRPPAPKLHCFAKPQTPLLCVSQLAGAAIINLDHLSSPPSRNHTRTVAVSQSLSIAARQTRDLVEAIHHGILFVTARPLAMLSSIAVAVLIVGIKLVVSSSSGSARRKLVSSNGELLLIYKTVVVTVREPISEPPASNKSQSLPTQSSNDVGIVEPPSGSQPSNYVPLEIQSPPPAEMDIDLPSPSPIPLFPFLPLPYFPLRFPFSSLCSLCL